MQSVALHQLCKQAKQKHAKAIIFIANNGFLSFFVIFYISVFLFKEHEILSTNSPILAAGRRKASVAQVKLVPGVGNVTINGKTANDYLQKDALSLHVIEEPLKTVYLEDKYDLVIKVQGGGLKGQAKAIQLGIARALSTYQNSFRDSLKEKGFLTRDSRVKERRKYGLKKARKASQFSKR